MHASVYPESCTLPHISKLVLGFVVTTEAGDAGATLFSVFGMERFGMELDSLSFISLYSGFK
jgi:hypothetical protein